MNLDKYKWKLRILLVETPSYKDKDYLKTKDIFEKNMYNFHKRYVKMMTNQDPKLKFKIKLVGFDGEVKDTYDKLNPQVVFDVIEAMPMGHLRNKLDPKNLSLFADYNPETTIKGLGYKNKEKAMHTIDRIKNEPIRYQINVVNTMLGRAKSHPRQTKEMREAIKIFEKWLKDFGKKKDVLIRKEGRGVDV